MSYLDMKLKEFIDVVDSDAPAPGGGSVSALASSLGIALSRMMAALAINKKKYREYDEMIKDEFIEKYDSLLKIREKIDLLIDEDTASFNELMKSFRLPKESVEEKTIRLEEIQKATLRATEVPFEIAEVSLKAMETLPFFYEYGNMNAITDLGVGAMLLEVGIRGAILNVKINLGGLDDSNLVEKFRTNYIEIEGKAMVLKESILKVVEKKIG
ncbi:MAG: cyclodeaminase/cyclohydrolase family protein [Psychrilyobacter sp.]|nr:cyclodeaminase/cyclohydrolase family protein [Psychrilyobacter sp.]